MTSRIELFRPPSAFQAKRSTYELLPFRFTRISGIKGEVLVTSETGEYHFLSEDDFRSLVRKQLSSGHPAYADLRAKKFLVDEMFSADIAVRLSAARLRSKKAFMRYGPSLHIVVVTLRCDHSCSYCQVSRQSTNAARFDLPQEKIPNIVDRIFESSSPDLTVEFQGGEPLLAFGTIRELVLAIERRNALEMRRITFVVASTLHLLTEETLSFFREHGVKVSTSLDGPEALHNKNRPLPSRDSYQRTVRGIGLARQALGERNVSALLTLTRTSLGMHREIVDSYVALGFRSIFLRPLSPFGFATRQTPRAAYTSEEFAAFYEAALAYIVDLNKQGITLEENYATLLLRHILTPFATGYVDLRSPAGAGLDTLVYNYDGQVYASDEARMLAEMGNTDYSLGSVSESLVALLGSAAMERLLSGAVAEALPGCSDCAYLPYCGADPIMSTATQGDPIGHRPSSSFCRRQTALFELMFRMLHERDVDTMRVLIGWLGNQSAHGLTAPGYLQ